MNRRSFFRRVAGFGLGLLGVKAKSSYSHSWSYLGEDRKGHCVVYYYCNGELIDTMHIEVPIEEPIYELSFKVDEWEQKI